MSGKGTNGFRKKAKGIEELQVMIVVLRINLNQALYSKK
jgi:hypothetical protein